MPLGKPDVTKFDSDDDSIKDARPEIQTAFTSLNTMIDEYTANGDTFGGVKEPYIHNITASQTVNAVDNRINVFRCNVGGTATLTVRTETLSNKDTHPIYFVYVSGTTNVELEENSGGQGQQTFQVDSTTANDFFLYNVHKTEIGFGDSAGSQYSVYYENVTGVGPYYFTP